MPCNLTSAVYALAATLVILATGPAAAIAAGEAAGSSSVAELVRLGAERLDAGDAAAAVEALERAVELAPDSPDALALLGRALALEDRYLAAEEALRQAVALGRTDLATWFFFGSTLWENGRVDEAEATFRAALARSGRNAPLLHQLGRLLLWTGRDREATLVLREASAANPDAADILLDLARALQAAGDLEAARGVYGKTVELQPENSRARYGLAVVFGRLGEVEEAAHQLAICRRMYREEQERVRQEGLLEARIAHGTELLRAGRPHDAIAHLQGLPETAEVLAVLAAAHQATGDLQAAVRALERAVALAPERGDLRTLLHDARLRVSEGS